MPAELVVGAQWGDEGKAKVIDYLSKDTDIIVRYQGGANAGHTVVVGKNKYVFHLVPSGVIYPKTQCVIGNGVVLDPEFFLEECDHLTKEGFDVYKKTFISDACHLLLPFHRTIDSLIESSSEPGKKIGTTKRGIGVCYADKMMRVGLRAGDILEDDTLEDRLKHAVDLKNKTLNKLYGETPASYKEILDQLKHFRDKAGHMIINTAYYLNEQLKQGKFVLLEGAQGTGLDVDFGTYPYVTSSNSTTGGAISGTGISYHYLGKVYGISKAYATRVGEGPFPTELFGEEGDRMRKLGSEFGATTGRPRRCGWFDTEMIKHAIRVNGMSTLVLTKIDILSDYDKIPVGVGYEINGKKLNFLPSHGMEKVKVIYEELPGWKSDITGINEFSKLPASCRDYINFLTKQIGIPIGIISTGPDRNDTIVCEGK
ncbi:MAG TPA: adenylosuccinate synthase [Leptospiraceae bacterium]|nr:adenylosuccinate synthase [Leptospiraceae bacterium]HNF13203.1 adenylosuccinate synthase [Leptospiraceae bacterium]HNF24602.1 adenylosuccinate synthase [Leptospiraceae bacterium]HNI95327.1 adenylosuccinate synthase [Leptospiraceae bacterium]HNM02039.1 adenylosuccinate synthase [Leptospiraceae bacterium]